LFSPVSVEEVVRGMPELGDEYELIVSKKGDTDVITLKVELVPGAETLQGIGTAGAGEAAQVERPIWHTR
jgi:phenylacetate-coenzyme A ligase PaaK-like adenylate-forming protein